MRSYEDHAWARAEALSKRTENAAARERRNEILARLIVGAICVGVVGIIALFIWAAHEGDPANLHGISPITATLRAQSTGAAHAASTVQNYREATPIRVRVVP